MYFLSAGHVNEPFYNITDVIVTLTYYALDVIIDLPS